jgi:TM2 domain-containing membrane protein YozV
MDWIQAQRTLSDKDLLIFNAELQRRSKSTALAYVLWFLLGGVGVHNFYMGKVYWGLLYLVLGAFGWVFFLAGLIAGGLASGATDGLAGTAILGILTLGLLGLFLLWDLFTIPRQIAVRQEGIKQELLAQLGAANQDVTCPAANKDATTPRTIWLSALLLALIIVSTLFFLFHGRSRYTMQEEKSPVMPPGTKNEKRENEKIRGFYEWSLGTHPCFQLDILCLERTRPHDGGCCRLQQTYATDQRPCGRPIFVEPG